MFKKGDLLTDKMASGMYIYNKRSDRDDDPYPVNVYNLDGSTADYLDGYLVHATDAHIILYITRIVFMFGLSEIKQWVRTADSYVDDELSKLFKETLIR
jgi:hypothetical protein